METGEGEGSRGRQAPARGGGEGGLKRAGEPLGRR